MHALDVLGDPVRRRIVEVLADGERSSGEIVDIIGAEFGISQPAVSQHLRTLRENNFAHVTPDGTRRIYTLDATGPRMVDDWLAPCRQFWAHRMSALATEIQRGKRERGEDDKPRKKR